MWKRHGRIHSTTASPPSDPEGIGTASPPLIRESDWHVRKRSMNELTPSHSGSSLRGRYDPLRCRKSRGCQEWRGAILFNGRKGRKVPLRPFPLLIDEGRGAAYTANRPADEYREKASLLLLAFSPFVGGVVLSEAVSLKYKGAKKEMLRTSGYSCTEPARLVKTSEHGGHTGSVSPGNVTRRQ